MYKTYRNFSRKDVIISQNIDEGGLQEDVLNTAGDSAQLVGLHIPRGKQTRKRSAMPNSDTGFTMCQIL